MIKISTTLVEGFPTCSSSNIIPIKGKNKDANKD